MNREGTPGPPLVTAAARLLLSYRDRLAVLLAAAENSNPARITELHRLVANLVEELTNELIGLYQRLQCGDLTETDRTIVLPALESLRTVLRQHSSRSLRDTLGKAITVVPISLP
jgi:hypothetical protein